MTLSGKSYVAERTIGRRKEDKSIRGLNSHYERLFQIGQIITSEIDMYGLFEVIIEQTNQVLGTQRSTVFVYDDRTNRLWSLVATGLKKNQIHIPLDSGITGWVFKNRAPVITNNAYDDPHFNAGIDKVTGFRTEKLLCVPLINREKQCIGVLEALNKISDDFNTQGLSLLTSISHYVSIVC